MKKMFAPLALFMLLTVSSVHGFADPSPQPAPSGFAQATPLVLAPAIVAVAEPAAPPAWVQSVMVSAEALPMVGPVIAKIMLYAGIVSSILTMLCAFMIGLLTTLAGAFQWAGFTNGVVAITSFQGGRFMYWLKYFSAFNAKKPDPL